MSRGRLVKDEESRIIEFNPTWSWTSKEEALGYLGGIIDGEGHIQFYDYGGRSIQIANTELSIIEASCAALDELEITYKVRKDLRYSKKRDKRFKDCYTIFIYRRENFEKILALVPIHSTSKKTKLEQMVAAYVRKPYKVYPYDKGGDAHAI